MKRQKKSSSKKPRATKKTGEELDPKFDQKFDAVAREVSSKYKKMSPQEVTAGSIQQSFHDAERKSSLADYVPTFPIVGAGASAGGVESFTQLLSDLPPDTGMAFVFILHLAPQRTSLLPDILARSTQMEVVRVEGTTKVQPNKVYVIPPNVNMGIISGELRLVPRIEREHRPIDFFFRCLSDDQGAFSIGVVLSGADSDGSQGLCAIKAQGGITLVQDPLTAKVDGMPRNAIAAGGSDTVLPIPGIAAELVRISKHPYIRAKETFYKPDELNHIFQILKQRKGVDFSRYKPATISRRVRRRILLHRVQDTNEYLELLRESPTEIDELYKDLLINVTSFFRDAESFESLKNILKAKLLKKQRPEDIFRVWVPACSTGEEVYSLAIILLEAADELKRPHQLQIFASDLSSGAIEKARDGAYHESILVDVSVERLRRFFTKSQGGYRVSSAIREMCVFAEHDLTRDPPFSRMDLVSCRNLLIYLDQKQQQNVVNLLAYSLNPGGHLFLGSSETTSGCDAFDVVDKKHRIYIRRPITTRAHFEVALNPTAINKLVPSNRIPRASSSHDLDDEVSKTLLARYVPSGLVINSGMQIVQFRGKTGDFLEADSGDASLNLFKMARDGLDTELRVAVKKAEKTKKIYRKEGLVLRAYKNRKFSLEVVPITVHDSQYYIILFDAKPYEGGVNSDVTLVDLPRSSSAGVKKLHGELKSTKEYLQSIIAEQDVANEELQAANEEVLSSNEELQSTNEELETAKEELQSTNEELTTVNDELASRNTELLQANNDLNNLLASVNIPIIMVGNDFRIRHFTPMVTRFMSILPTDLGRPITDIKFHLDIPDLEKLLTETIDNIQTVKVEIKDTKGRAYSLRIRPYRTAENKISGAVLIFVDIGPSTKFDAIKRDGDELNLDLVNQPVLLLDRQMRIRNCNSSFFNTFQMRNDEVIDRGFFEIHDNAWEIPLLKALLDDVFSKGIQIVDFKVEKEFSSIGAKNFDLSAQPLQFKDIAHALVTLTEEE